MKVVTRFDMNQTPLLKKKSHEQEVKILDNNNQQKEFEEWDKVIKG